MAQEYHQSPTDIVFGRNNELSLMERQMFDMFILRIGLEEKNKRK